MEEHGLTDAERKLLLGLLNDPEAEAGGADSLVSEAEQAEQQLDELEAQDWDFASKDPAQEVQNPDDGEDSDDVGQLENALYGGDAWYPQERQEIEDVVAMPTLWKMGPSTLRLRPDPGIVVRDHLLQSSLSFELYTQSIAEGRPKRVFTRLEGPEAIGCFPGMEYTLYKFHFSLSTEELQEENPGYFQVDPQYNPVLVRTERTNLEFDTAIQGIEASQSLIFLHGKDETHILEYDATGNISWRHKESTPGIISLAVGKEFEANEVGIISPDAVQILSVQHGWTGKLDIKNGTCADWLSTRTMLVGSKGQLFLGDGRESCQRVVVKSQIEHIRAIKCCPWNSAHVAVTTYPWHKVKVYDVRYMRKPLDEHMLPDEGAYKGPCSPINPQRYYEVDWSCGSSQWMYASCLGGYDVVARSWVTGGDAIGASEFSLADNSGLKSDRDINLGSIVLPLVNRQQSGLAVVRNMNNQGPRLTWLEEPHPHSHVSRHLLRRKDTPNLEKQTIVSFIECILDRLVETGLIHLEEFGRRATIKHIFQGREDTKTVLDSFCWVWDALKKMGIWKIDMDPTELAVVVVFFDNSGGVLLTATDEKAVEVPLHVKASVAALDACVEELLQGTDPSSQVIVYMKEEPQASGSSSSAALPSACGTLTLLSRNAVESRFAFPKAEPQVEEASTNVEPLEEMVDSSDNRLLAGLRWLEVEDAAVIQILVKCGMIKGNFGAFDMDYEEDHESTDLQTFDIVHRAKKRCTEDHRKAHLHDFFHQRRMKDNTGLREQATRMISHRRDSHKINGPVTEEEEQIVLKCLRSGEPLTLASWPAAKRLHGVMMAMNLTSLPPGITPADFGSVSNIDTVSLKELLEVAKVHQTHHGDEPGLRKIGVELLVRALVRTGLLACSTTAPDEFHSLQTFAMNHTPFQQLPRECNPFALSIQAQRLQQRWGRHLHAEPNYGNDFEQIQDISMRMCEFLMASPRLAWHKSLASELPSEQTHSSPRPEGDQEDEQGTPEGIQESWQSLVHQLQPSDLSKVYEHLSEEYLIRFGTVDDRKVVVHSEFGPTDLARLFRMTFQLAGTNLSVPNHPTGPQLPLVKFEGLDTRSKRSYDSDLQKQMDDWDAKVGRALKSEAEQKQGLKRSEM